MVYVASQESYDEIVKENITEFGMTPEEAIEEAVAQYKAQGVELSNIILDLALTHLDRHLVVVAVENLKSFKQQNEKDDEVWLKEINLLKCECKKDLARRCRAGKDGAYDILIDLLQQRYCMYSDTKNDKDAKFLLEILKCLTALMDGQPDLLDINGTKIMMKILEDNNNVELLIATMRWASKCCIKHELNRQNIFAQNIVPAVKAILKKPQHNELLVETLSLIRKFTLDDDIRVQFGKAHEHSREFAIHTLDRLCALLKENTKPPLVSDLMLTIATLLVRDELCAAVADSLDTLRDVLIDNFENAPVIQEAFKLLKALAGNDEAKRKIIDVGMGPIIVSLMHEHMSNPKIPSLALQCVGALTLREPNNARVLIENNVHLEIINLMKVHASDVKACKNGAVAIRNIAGRCVDAKDKFKENGAEEILNEMLKNTRGYEFEFKSALRDLDCKVQLDEQWKGTGRQLEQ